MKKTLFALVFLAILATLGAPASARSSEDGTHWSTYTEAEAAPKDAPFYKTEDKNPGPLAKNEGVQWIHESFVEMDMPHGTVGIGKFPEKTQIVYDLTTGKPIRFYGLCNNHIYSMREVAQTAPQSKAEDSETSADGKATATATAAVTNNYYGNGTVQQEPYYPLIGFGWYGGWYGGGGYSSSYYNEQITNVNINVNRNKHVNCGGGQKPPAPTTPHNGGYNGGETGGNSGQNGGNGGSSGGNGGVYEPRKGSAPTSVGNVQRASLRQPLPEHTPQVDPRSGYLRGSGAQRANGNVFGHPSIPRMSKGSGGFSTPRSSGFSAPRGNGGGGHHGGGGGRRR